MEKALAGTTRKVSNLNKNNKSNNDKPIKLNFGGQENELCCAGGEIAFLKNMVKESKDFALQVCWFSSLVSKSENISPLKKQLEQIGAKHIKVVKMAQGQKVSRLIAWSFLAEPNSFNY